MQTKGRRALLLVSTFACAVSAHAARLILLPGETLQIQFIVSPVHGFTPNAIGLSIEGSGPTSGGTITNPPIQFTSELFNGTTFLGTNVSSPIANTRSEG
jgi:hypothetical protein